MPDCTIPSTRFGLPRRTVPHTQRWRTRPRVPSARIPLAPPTSPMMTTLSLLCSSCAIHTSGSRHCSALSTCCALLPLPTPSMTRPYRRCPSTFRIRTCCGRPSIRTHVLAKGRSRLLCVHYTRLGCAHSASQKRCTMTSLPHLFVNGESRLMPLFVSSKRDSANIPRPSMTTALKISTWLATTLHPILRACGAQISTTRRRATLSSGRACLCRQAFTRMAMKLTAPQRQFMVSPRLWIGFSSMPGSKPSCYSFTIACLALLHHPLYLICSSQRTTGGTPGWPLRIHWMKTEHREKQPRPAESLHKQFTVCMYSLFIEMRTTACGEMVWHNDNLWHSSSWPRCAVPYRQRWSHVLSYSCGASFQLARSLNPIA
mmetsp:Transcript_54053/g.74153  ORF Transcript_54053/g.74153 Transcript_54053/m.74153 type:complete len:373 (+) Transcript_54053:407-1525(+)